MKHENICFCFLITLSWILTTEGLQCPSCTYLTSDADVPALDRTVIDAILHLFQDPECAKDLKGQIPQIREETCAMTSGKVSRCSFYNGSVTITIPANPDVSVPFQIYQRGCYQSRRANVPSNGCHDKENINKDETFIKQILNKASSAFEVAKFAGEMCLCTETYCTATTSVSPLPVSTSTCLLSTTTSGVSACAKKNTLLILFLALVYFI